MGPISDGESGIQNGARVGNLMQEIVGVFRNNVRSVLDEEAEKIASEFVDELKFRIASQSFNHAPLSERYRRSKIESRLDPRILISSGDYLNAIGYDRVQDESGVITYRCGVRRGIHPGSQLPYWVLARILELGAVRGGRRVIPPRPHWRPMISIFQQRRRQFAEQAEASLAQRVRDQMS